MVDIDLDGDVDGWSAGEIQVVVVQIFFFEMKSAIKIAGLGSLVGDGDRINRDAIGAKVKLVYENETLIRDIQSARGCTIQPTGASRYSVSATGHATIEWKCCGRRLHCRIDAAQTGETDIGCSPIPTH